MNIAKFALLVTAGAAASGSIALASTTSGWPPTQPGRVLPAVAATQAQQHAADALAGHPNGSQGAGRTKSEQHGSPNPNLNGLCHAWLAGAGREHGNARSNPAFSVLVAAAGGSDAVDGYCTTLIGSQSHPGDESSEAPEPSESEEPESPPSHHGNPNHPGKTSHPGRPPFDVPPTHP